MFSLIPSHCSQFGLWFTKRTSNFSHVSVTSFNEFSIHAIQSQLIDVSRQKQKIVTCTEPRDMPRVVCYYYCFIGPVINDYDDNE